MEPDTKNEKIAKSITQNLMSSSLVETIAFWAGVITVLSTAIAALAGSLSWYFSNKVSVAKDDALSRFKTESKVAIAEADARAAEANKKAEEERLERLKLEAKVSWRRLSPEQHDKLVQALSAHSFAMYFEYSQSDPEAVQFAEDIFKSLKDAAGITVYPHPLVLPPAPPGVTVSGSLGEDKKALEFALTRAGIKFKSDGNSTGVPRISIGSKPSPF